MCERVTLMMEVTVVATIKLCMFYCELAGNAIENKWDHSQKKKEVLQEKHCESVIF